MEAMAVNRAGGYSVPARRTGSGLKPEDAKARHGGDWLACGRSEEQTGIHLVSHHTMDGPD